MTSAEPTPGDGRFLLKRGMLPPGRHKLMMIAISEDNLVVTREVEITIAE